MGARAPLSGQIVNRLRSARSTGMSYPSGPRARPMLLRVCRPAQQRHKAREPLLRLPRPATVRAYRQGIAQLACHPYMPYQISLQIGPAAYLLGDLALEVLTVAQIAEELAVVNNNFPAQDGDRWPGMYFVSLPRRVICLV